MPRRKRTRQTGFCPLGGPENGRGGAPVAWVFSPPSGGAFGGEGLRDIIEYRDLDITEATKQQVKVHKIRVKDNGDPSSLHTTGLYIHELAFQMIYILKGWIKLSIHLTDENDQVREQQQLGPGDCCLQPPKIIHNGGRMFR